MTILIIIEAIQLLILSMGVFLLIRLLTKAFFYPTLNPYVPTPRKTAKKMAELAALRDGERACDIGSGTGTLLFPLIKLFPRNEIVGYEISLLLRVITRIK